MATSGDDVSVLKVLSLQPPGLQHSCRVFGSVDGISAFRIDAYWYRLTLPTAG
jgi:hypothetical protein